MTTIREAVAVSLSMLSERTRNQVVEHFASIEAMKQATALIKGLDTLSGLEKDLSKIRPQNTMFNAEGQPVGDPTFTKDQIETRKKTTEKIEKLTKAINKADDVGDFGDLYSFANQNQQKGE